MNLQDILNLIQGGPQQGLRPTGISGTNPLQSFGNIPTNPFPPGAATGANGGGPMHSSGPVLGGFGGGMGSGGK